MLLSFDSFLGTSMFLFISQPMVYSLIKHALEQIQNEPWLLCRSYIAKNVTQEEALNILSIDFGNEYLIHPLESIIDQIHMLHKTFIAEFGSENASEGEHDEFFIRLLL